MINSSFAEWLAEQEQAHVLIYDYAGTGKSKRASLKDYETNLFDWSVRDTSSALQYAFDSYPGVPVSYIGVSVGGNMFHSLKNLNQIDTVNLFACGFITSRNMWPKYNLLFKVLWYSVGPLATVLRGYYPGKSLKYFFDMPRNVFWQWRRWDLSPNSFFSDSSDLYEKLACKELTKTINFITFSDDPLMTHEM